MENPSSTEQLVVDSMESGDEMDDDDMDDDMDDEKDVISLKELVDELIGPIKFNLSAHCDDRIIIETFDVEKRMLNYEYVASISNGIVNWWICQEKKVSCDARALLVDRDEMELYFPRTF